MTRVLALAIGLIGLAVLPPLTANRVDILNLFFLILLYVTLGQSWNILGGFTGQVNLGHAAFFGIGVMVARQLWLAGHWPYPLAFVVGGMVAALYGYLYVVLTNEDYALLIGSLGVFAILAAIMYLTRRVDWYGTSPGIEAATER